MNFIGEKSATLEYRPQPAVHAVKCTIMLAPDTLSIRCEECESYRNNLRALASRNSRSLTHVKTSIKVAATAQDDATMTDESVETTIQVSDELHTSLLGIAKAYETIAAEKNESFGNVFWQQQLKNLQTVPSGRRWHPTMIKWCLYLHHLSSSAYELLNKSDSFALPSARTLRDYTHYFENKAGFSDDVDKQLADMIQLDKLEDHQKLVCLTFDEMKIKEGLVFDKSNNELIGFTDLGNVNETVSMLERLLLNSAQSKQLASSVFAVMVQGLIIKFNFPYASFPALNLTGAKIAPILLEATFRLERMGLKVLAHTSDGCAINRKYFKIMASQTLGQTDVPYKMENPFTDEERYIYFISDPPHLIKTTRNCLFNPRRKLEVS